MKFQPLYGLLTTGIVLALSVNYTLAGVEEPIDLADIPVQVMEVAESSLSGLRLAVDESGPVDDGSVIDDNIVIVYEELGDVTLVSANTETEEDGSFVYEIQGTTADGRRIEIDLDPEANIEEIEVEFKLDDVPAAVLQSVKEQMPEFTSESIEASHSPSMQVIGYEFVGLMGDTPLDIEVSADGRTIEIADQ